MAPLYPYPPERVAWERYATNLEWLMLAALLAGLLVLGCRWRRPATVTDAVFWFVMLGASLWLAMSRQHVRFVGSGPAEPMWFLFVMWLIAGLGLLRALYRLAFSGQEEAVGHALAINVVLAVAGGMIVFTPAISTARGEARRSQCRGHLKYLALAMHNYHDTSDRFPDASFGEPAVSWRTLVLPYVDEPKLYDAYDRRADWDSRDNAGVVGRFLSIYACPSEHDRGGPFGPGPQPTSYAQLNGPGTAAGRPLSDFTDGASSTFLIVEACGLGLRWAEPRDVDVATLPPGVNRPGQQPGRSDGWLSSVHPLGVHVALADGSVRFVSEQTDLNVLRQAAAINDGGGWNDEPRSEK